MVDGNKGPTLKERLGGNVFTTEQVRAKVEQGKKESKIETMKKVYFNPEQGGGLVIDAVHIHEINCQRAGTRELKSLIDNPEFQNATIMVAKVIGGLNRLGGKLTGWSFEGGYENTVYSPNIHRSLESIKTGDEVVLIEPGLTIEDKVVAKPLAVPREHLLY